MTNSEFFVLFLFVVVPFFIFCVSLVAGLILGVD